MLRVFYIIKTIILVNVIGLGALLSLGDSDEDDSSRTSTETEYVSTADVSSEDVRISDLSAYFDTSAIREKQVKLKGNGEDVVTILVYVNGSDLESDDSEATTDISEMVSAGTSDKVNCLIQTMGTKKWNKKFGIAADHSQRYKIVDDGLELVDDSLGQLDCTDPATLTDFIKWGTENYPANRYILMFWDHGAGPVYGFGYDEWQGEDESMTMAEMQNALSSAGVYFDFIGMDCCIMSCMETTLALYDYCDYAILSEEYESGLGWSYKGWLSAINQNSSIDTVSLAKIAIDDNVNENENDSVDGSSACMSLIDESMMKILYTAWVNFAYENEDALLGENYSQKVTQSDRTHPLLRKKSLSDYYDYFSDCYSNLEDIWDSYSMELSDYYITDIMAVAQNIDSDSADALAAAVSSTIIYNRTTSDDTSLTGLSVTLPYGDSDFYEMLKSVFAGCGIDIDYIAWLGKFVTAEGADDYYDYDSQWNDWDGWDSYDDDYDWDEWDYSGDGDYWGDDDLWGWDSGDIYYDDYTYYNYGYDDPEDYLEYSNDGPDYYIDYDDPGYFEDYDDPGYYEDYGGPGYYDDYYYDDYDYDDYGDFYDPWFDF